MIILNLPLLTAAVVFILDVVIVDKLEVSTMPFKIIRITRLNQNLFYYEYENVIMKIKNILYSWLFAF